MAAIKQVLGKCQFLRQNGPIFTSLSQQMAMYPNYYVDPVYRKQDQQELAKLGELAKYANLPTKAAANNQTCSASHDPLLALFTNYVMRHGQKSLAREQVEKCLETVKRIQLERYHKTTAEEERVKILLNPKVVFHEAVENCKPLLQLTGIKRGGVRYQVPVPITDRRALFISMNWLIQAAQEKDRKVRFSAQLARELVDAANNTGRVVRKKQELHRQCEANKAYAHYRWS